VQGAGGAVGAAGDDLDVVGLGALNVDLIAAAAFDAPGRFADLEDNETLVATGEIGARIVAGGLTTRTYLGGSAYNAMAMLAGLGTALRLGMIGISTAARDHRGRRHAGCLRQLGIVDVTHRSSGRPGQCLALTEGNRRRLYTSPEANLGIARYLTADDRPRAAAAGARVLHLTSLLEDPGIPGSDAVARAVAAFVAEVKADHPDLLLSFDPGRTWVDGLADLPVLRRLYRLADLLYVSPQEYSVLSGRPFTGVVQEASLVGLCSPGATLIVKPSDQIVIRAATGHERARVPRTDGAAAVDPTGAGDAVAAGVLAAHAAGGTIVDGCRLGLWIAEHRVSAPGDGGHVALSRAPLLFPWLAELPADRLPDPGR